MSTKIRRKARERLRLVLRQHWFANEREKNESVKLIRENFPRARFDIKVSWQQEKDIITLDKVKEIIRDGLRYN